MLEPRESDIPALFLVLVVLPLVAYILLGKWSEAAKKGERISLLAQLAAEEALRAEAMDAASVIPLVSPSKNGLHVCARCFGPARTRCSGCKSIRYCSGKCQIIHWRQAHKQECQLVETTSCSSPEFTSSEDFILLNDGMNLQLCGYNIKQTVMEKAPPDNTVHSSISIGAFASVDCYAGNISQVSMLGRRTTDKRCSRKSNREPSKRENCAVLDSSEETYWNGATNSPCANNSSSKEGFLRHKSRTSDSDVSEEILKKHHVSNSNMHINEQSTAISTTHESCKHQGQHGNMLEPRSNCGSSDSSYSAKFGATIHETETEFIQNGGNSLRGDSTFNNETSKLNCSLETTVVRGGVKPKSALNSQIKIVKLPKSTVKMSGETERKEQIADGSKVVRIKGTIPAQENNGMASMGIMKMMSLRKSTKFFRQNGSEQCDNRHKKMKMLFPYEEFVKFFQCEVSDLSPRGLLNCGNSCYANAVLQSLTCTKPLIIYLLRRSHSRACCGKDWCLTCELEQHVMMLRESGGPLSPSRILFHMRNFNCQIGDGSQEDAHEFLRLLIASMQSICLEGLGGEGKVDPRLQGTTFIQHAFGGRLQSKVKCLRCYHELERYEKIMDLTLEIYSCVESLEDALTQFTTPEDLDGENMYRCGRCAAYVRARKQLSIHEAPNILTIVLKRFQEGSYGKINKCITFPEMLDMIPFMTGAGDIPPLYMLYAVVVHLDTLNASFSGHYVSYVKDLRGNWSRIDDTEVHPVPMSQVMSEGAYILFYMRSYPRPQKEHTEKAIRQQVPASVRHCKPKDQNPSRPVKSRPPNDFVGTQPSSDLRPKTTTGFANHATNGILRSTNTNIQPVMEKYSEPANIKFSDATSNDWSLFTSSDEASFTTESTRDSCSTVVYTDACNVDPFSIFNTLYCPESSSRNTVACRMFANSRAQTRFFSEEKGYFLDSYLSSQPPNRMLKGENSKQVNDSMTEFPSDSNCSMFVKYQSNPKYTRDRTSGHCYSSSWEISSDF